MRVRNIYQVIVRYGNHGQYLRAFFRHQPSTEEVIEAFNEHGDLPSEIQDKIKAGKIEVLPAALFERIERGTLTEQEQALLKDKGKIAAIKAVRHRLGIGLKETWYYVNGACNDL